MPESINGGANPGGFGSGLFSGAPTPNALNDYDDLVKRTFQQYNNLLGQFIPHNPDGLVGANPGAHLAEPPDFGKQAVKAKTILAAMEQERHIEDLRYQDKIKEFASFNNKFAMLTKALSQIHATIMGIYAEAIDAYLRIIK